MLNRALFVPPTGSPAYTYFSMCPVVEGPLFIDPQLVEDISQQVQQYIHTFSVCYIPPWKDSIVVPNPGSTTYPFHQFLMSIFDQSNKNGNGTFQSFPLFVKNYLPGMAVGNSAGKITSRVCNPNQLSFSNQALNRSEYMDCVHQLSPVQYPLSDRCRQIKHGCYSGIQKKSCTQEDRTIAKECNLEGIDYTEARENFPLLLDLKHYPLYGLILSSAYLNRLNTVIKKMKPNLLNEAKESQKNKEVVTPIKLKKLKPKKIKHTINPFSIDLHKEENEIKTSS